MKEMSNPNTVQEKRYILEEHSVEETPLCAFPQEATVRFSVLTDCTQEAESAVMRIHSDSVGKMTLYPMRKQGSNAFTADVKMSEICGEEKDGLFYYCYDVYYPTGCVTYGGDGEDLVPCTENEKRPLLVYREESSVPDWLHGGILYHIFVDRFCSSRHCPVKDDVILNTNWEEGEVQYPEYPGADFKNNMFFGGDLYGIANKMEYIASLGVSCIYLSPIFDAASNHKYDTGDYEHVDSMFGGDEALEHLIETAAAYKIKIILDGVFNHTGADSRYFNKYGRYTELGAYQSKDSPFYAWYSFSKYPDVYESWWGIDILPRVRCDEESYRKYILGREGIVRRWMEKGIAGWRLDVADELSDGFLEAFHDCVREADPKAILYGEVWEDAANKIAYGKRRRYLRGEQLDSVMNYPLREAVIRYIRFGEAEQFTSCVERLIRHYPKRATDLLMNILGTHDTVRILTALGDVPADRLNMKELSEKKMCAEQRGTAESLLVLAYALISFLPGIPCIYYGDEAGMEGYGDPFCRRPYPWGKEKQNLLQQYRRIGKIRRENPVFKVGHFRVLLCEEKCCVFMRYDKTNPSMILVLNRSVEKQSFIFTEFVTDLEENEEQTHVSVEAMQVRYFITDNLSISVSHKKFL